MPPPKEGEPLTASEIDLLRSGSPRGAEYKQHWAWSAPERAPSRSGSTAGVPEPDRRFRPRAAADRGPEALARGRPPHPDPPASPRPDRAAADAGGGRRLRPRTRSRRLRAGRGPAARPRRTTASSGRACGSTSPATPTPTATGSTGCRLNIWPYRDWVIKRLQRQPALRQFTIEQLAGDLLPDPTHDQRIATALPPQHDDQQRGRHDARNTASPPSRTASPRRRRSGWA